MEYPSVAIIIPVKQFNEKLRVCIEECLRLDYPSFEVLVFPDAAFSEFSDRIRVIPSGCVGPAVKRDMALQHSEAELFAFIDDDAYPHTDWLNKAAGHFRNESVAAVGGPGITPKNSGLMEKAGGCVYGSVLASGSLTYRYVPGATVKDIDDYPSCNLIVRRTVFAQVGGFDNDYYPGEDTKLCLDITKKLGKRIIYDPAVIVEHHRRKLFAPHLKQIANYALHRGYFCRTLPQTSRRPMYFIPSLFLLFTLGGAAPAALNPVFFRIYVVIWGVYGILLAATCAVSLRREKTAPDFFAKVCVFGVACCGIVATHFWYGYFFLKGLTAAKLKDGCSMAGYRPPPEQQKEGHENNNCLSAA